MPEPDGTTALHLAVQRDDRGNGRTLLIRAGANVKAANRYGMHAAARGRHQRQRGDHRASCSRPARIRTPPLPEGETVLMTAARTGDAASVKLLLARGADVNVKEGWKGQTALMWAAAENNAAAIKVLIEAGAERQRPLQDRRVHAAPVCGPRRARRRVARAARRRRGRQRAAARRHEPAGAGRHQRATTSSPRFCSTAAPIPMPTARGGRRCIRSCGPAGRIPASTCPAPSPTGNLDSLDLARKLVKLGADVNARQKKEPKDGYRNQLNRIGATPFLLAAKSVRSCR